MPGLILTIFQLAQVHIVRMIRMKAPCVNIKQLTDYNGGHNATRLMDGHFQSSQNA